ncbi:MAG TPA: DegQ family serine endoprotease [Gammaproteobacteria bacterium]|nr:DegQ family serine endoprotease [Gammaproteobacteria bacterium]
MNIRIEQGYIRCTWHLALFALLAFLATVRVEAGSLPDFTDIVKGNSAAVVNISTTQKITQRRSPFPHGRMPEFPEGSPFGEWFRRFFGEQGDELEEYNTESLGSGFVISKDGYVLTNHHVIKGADEIVVRLSDRRQLVAELVGSDPRSDVALLKIDAEGLPTVDIGQSSRLEVGEWVLAIGSPFDFDHTVTAGIVSALGRSLPNENYVPFIQTDVAINPGNSGGPLFNMDGEVVGINAQIYSRTGGFMGLSFAIPIDLAMEVVDQLKDKGKVSRGWLGVLIQDVTRDLAESFGMDRPEGALVSQVLPDSPAEKSGLRVGDVIVKFGGRHIPDSASLPPIVGRTMAGETVPVEVVRDGKRKEIRVKIGELPEDEELKLASRGEKSFSEDRLGAVVAELNDEQRKSLDGKRGGVVVKDVKGGAARAAGLRDGDIILKINGVDVEGVEQFRKLIDALPADRSVPMLIQRGDGPMFLALKLGDEDG